MGFEQILIPPNNKIGLFFFLVDAINRLISLLLLSIGSFGAIPIGRDVEYIDFDTFISMLNFKMSNEIKVFVLLVVGVLAVDCGYLWTVIFLSIEIDPFRLEVELEFGLGNFSWLIVEERVWIFIPGSGC